MFNTGGSHYEAAEQMGGARRKKLSRGRGSRRSRGSRRKSVKVTPVVAGGAKGKKRKTRKH